MLSPPGYSFATGLFFCRLGLASVSVAWAIASVALAIALVAWAIVSVAWAIASVALAIVSVAWAIASGVVAVYSAVGISGWAFGSSPYWLGPCVPSLQLQISKRIAPTIGMKIKK